MKKNVKNQIDFIMKNRKNSEYNFSKKQIICMN